MRINAPIFWDSGESQPETHSLLKALKKITPTQTHEVCRKGCLVSEQSRFLKVKYRDGSSYSSKNVYLRQYSLL